MIPIEGKSSYAVVETPTHYAAIVEQFGWSLAYPEFVGGIVAFDQESFEKINGYCNEYWGWGAEDDDLYRRCKINDVKFMRRHNMYSSLNHDRVILKDEYTKNLSVLQEWEKWKNDGLATLKYNIKETLEDLQYLKIIVDI
jgi:predicted glycosyltransferase involved in capsule biosynthesis